MMQPNFEKTTLPLPFRVIFLLGFVTAVGPLATDMYLPAFPELQRDLHCTSGQAQLTIGAWFIGLSVGQFLQGPLSDRFGRRSPLMLGMLLFTLASAGCAMVHDYTAFFIYRLIGAFGGSASVVISRAVVRDVATGKKGAQIMSQLALIFGVMPVLAPSLGSFVLGFANWRWIFWVAVAYGLLSILGIATTLPDTLSVEKRIPFHPVMIARRYVGILKERVFLSNALTATFSSFVTFAYVSSAPLLFEQTLHFSSANFGLFFGLNACTFIITNQLNNRLIHYMPIPVIVRRALCVSILLGLAFIALALSQNTSNISALFICLLIMGISATLGFIGSNCTVMSLTCHAPHAASASALLGCMQFGIGACSSILVSIIPQIGALPMAVGMMTGILGMVFSSRIHHEYPAGIDEE